MFRLLIYLVWRHPGALLHRFDVDFILSLILNPSCLRLTFWPLFIFGATTGYLCSFDEYSGKTCLLHLNMALTRFSLSSADKSLQPWNLFLHFFLFPTTIIRSGSSSSLPSCALLRRRVDFSTAQLVIVPQICTRAGMNADRSSLHLDGIPADKQAEVQKTFPTCVRWWKWPSGSFAEVSLTPEEVRSARVMVKVWRRARLHGGRERVETGAWMRGHAESL